MSHWHEVENKLVEVEMPKQQNTIEIHIPSVLGYEKVAMDSAAAVAEIMQFHRSRVEDLKTAVSEACINAIEHGNRLKKSTAVLVTLKMCSKSLEVHVHDQGRGLESELVNPNIDAQVESKADTRGWGVFLIRNLVDEVEFKRVPEGGNVTRMVIRLGS